MMTEKEKWSRIVSQIRLADTIRNRESATYKNYRELRDYIEATKLPESLERAACKAAEEYREQYIEESYLASYITLATQKIDARPFIVTSEDGTTHIEKGYLPNEERTSTDEAEALQMFDDFLAQEAKSA